MGRIIGRKISRDLVVWLTLLISIVISFSGAAYYYYFTVDSQRELNKDITYLAGEFVEVITLPLWNNDPEMIAKISKAYLNSKYLTGIRVESNFGELLFDTLPYVRRSSEIVKKIMISNENIELGNVELLFSDESIQKTQQMMVYAIAVNMLLVIIAIIIGTNIIMKSLLIKPLEQLVEGIKGIAEGDYKNVLTSVKQEEMNAIIDAVNSMADQIEEREMKLEKKNL
ncbi:hypothetical protein KKA14_22085, partial [bacterium]|nr:hypothetical protein [bacterium]